MQGDPLLDDFRVSQGIKLAWRSIDYSVKASHPSHTYERNRPLSILKDCSGVAFPGQTLFILGPSGVGKLVSGQALQTLLDSRLRKSQQETATWAQEEAARSGAGGIGGAGGGAEGTSRFERVFKSESGQDFSFNYTAKNLKTDEG